MNEFINHLTEFNRKERFFLIGQALGNENFILSPEFRIELKLALPNLSKEIPDNAFAAMDYHLDWIYGSAFLSENKNQVKLHPLDKKYISATQEDIDLIVAFEDRFQNQTHLIMCECKAETGWTNKQIQSKGSRLKNIFGKDGKNFQSIIPYFILISPRKPLRIDTLELPSFMINNGEIPWMSLRIPEKLKKITRSNELGRNDKDGRNWRIEYT
ncbi:MAG: hypothetical protein K9J12_06130 [Melioribacteraceae bacterium]|nr:hypothetical protein [Melioribacteraceae bacterium]MCF8264666.1 hypothetical protein [Melioribacteraceae bacterium]MCF8412843.1 hypothetical protein [Melioribacteraceae bacterium]